MLKSGSPIFSTPKQKRRLLMLTVKYVLQHHNGTVVSRLGYLSALVRSFSWETNPPPQNPSIDRLTTLIKKENWLTLPELGEGWEFATVEVDGQILIKRQRKVFFGLFWKIEYLAFPTSTNSHHITWNGQEKNATGFSREESEEIIATYNMN